MARGCARRSRARSDLGERLRGSNIPVFIHTADPQKFWDPIDYTNERWLELALFRDRRYQDPALSAIRNADGRARSAFQEASEDDVRDSAPRVARQRSRSPGTHVRRDAERVQRDRRRALRHRQAAAVCARLLRQVSGPAPVRQRQLPAGRVSVLLAGPRNERRVLRLLPRLPRLLETVRNRAARRCSQEAILSKTP